MSKPHLTPTEKLKEMMEAEGYFITAWFPSRGYWTHRQQDVMRWTAHSVRGSDIRGPIFHLEFWDTICDCVKYGITLAPTESYRTFDVSANKPFDSSKVALHHWKDDDLDLPPLEKDTHAPL
jgi:hypothetical protein